MTYNLAFKNLFQVIRRNAQLLYPDDEVKKVFSPAPFVFFQKYEKHEKVFERKVGSEKCKSKGCFVCLNVSETDVF